MAAPRVGQSRFLRGRVVLVLRPLPEIKQPFSGPCDCRCDLDWCFWNFWYFERFVFCITCLFSMGYERTSPPLRTTKTLSESVLTDCGLKMREHEPSSRRVQRGCPSGQSALVNADLLKALVVGQFDHVVIWAPKFETCPDWGASFIFNHLQNFVYELCTDADSTSPFRCVLSKEP